MLAADDRLRHHAQNGRMHAPDRRNARQRSAPPTPVQDWEARLASLPYPVGGETVRHRYVPNVGSFLDFTLDWDLPKMSRGENGNSILIYLDYMFEDEEAGPHWGASVVYGVVNLGSELFPGLPRSGPALLAGPKMHMAVEGCPLPRPVCHPEARPHGIGEVRASLHEEACLAGSSRGSTTSNDGTRSRATVEAEAAPGEGA